MRVLAAFLLSLLVVPIPARPQALEPASTGGVVALHRVLERLDTHRRVLVIGAHPDDEDTALLALVARGMGGEAAYLSLSRGEGGQNLIGPELGEELGLIRTQELLAARAIDGARQFFTRAYDFGYTRSLDETNERWPPERVLEDTVRVVRRFKPQVVVSIFPTSADAGHGQHQAAGVAAHDAFAAAGDAGRFAELEAQGLPAWRPAALYRSAFFRPTPESITLPTGHLDPGSGKTYFQLAMASRSMHRSQDMGVLQDTGPRATRVTWVAGAGGGVTVAAGGGPGEGAARVPSAAAVEAGAPPGSGQVGDLFAGIDTRLRAIAEVLAVGPERVALAAALDRVAAEVAATRGVLAAGRLDVAASPLRDVVTTLERATQRLASAALDASERQVALDLVGEKLDLAREAVGIASGWVVDATTEAPVLVPGGSATVKLAFYNSGAEPARVTPSLRASAGWAVPRAGAREVGAGALETWEVQLTVPGAAAPSLPYFLAAPRQGDLYDWSGVAAAVRGEPFEPPLLVAVFAVESAGAPAIAVEREVVHRFRDQAIGERRRPLRVVPALEVSVAPERLLWADDSPRERTVRVTLRKHVAEEVAGRVEIESPRGWPEVAPVPFRLEASRDSRTVDVRIARGVEAVTQTVAVRAALDSGAAMRGAVPIIDYPHLRPVPAPRPSAVEVRSLDLELPALRAVGYVRGASDRVPESLLEVGLPLQILSGVELLDLGDEGLRRFDAIVLGSRAYEVDPELVEAHQRLLDYVRDGGLLVVQYQQYDFVQRKLAPYALDMARPHDRIADEASPVEVLVPDHPAVSRPHRIGAADWEGWVQERGLYFARSWDPAFKPLLRLQDPGMPPQDGGLLVARLGNGTYIYTGLAFFRQLPAGVPGAFRLFVNLLATGS